MLYKPHAGMFSLWKRSGLSRSLHWFDDYTGKKYRGVGRGYIWPPPKESLRDNDHGHSSPGVLLMIAERLLVRAERLLSQVHTVMDAVHGAVLATDALELLGGRTPTLSIEALKVKHHFEVLAECQFTGIQHHVGLHERLEEIERDVKAIGQWFGPKQQMVATLNAEMAILLDLVRLLRNNGKFDEEQKVMNRVRHIQNTLWLRNRAGRFSWRSVFWVPLRYSEFLLSSFSRFFLCIIAWISGLTGAFLLVNTYEATSSSEGTTRPLVNSFSNAFHFFSGSDPLNQQGDVFFTLLAAFSVTVGLAHLGIFIAHLYTLVTRK